MTRQELATILARLLRLLATDDPDRLARLADAHLIPDWSRPAISGLLPYMSTYPDGTFRPAQPVTRAEAVTVIWRLMRTVVSDGGTYGPSSPVTDDGRGVVSGNLTISGRGVTLRNTVIEGDLYCTAGSGGLTLEGVEVRGRIILSGGTESPVILDGTSADELVVFSPHGSLRIEALRRRFHPGSRPPGDTGRTQAGSDGLGG